MITKKITIKSHKTIKHLRAVKIKVMINTVINNHLTTMIMIILKCSLSNTN